MEFSKFWHLIFAIKMWVVCIYFSCFWETISKRFNQNSMKYRNFIAYSKPDKRNEQFHFVIFWLKSTRIPEFADRHIVWKWRMVSVVFVCTKHACSSKQSMSNSFYFFNSNSFYNFEAASCVVLGVDGVWLLVRSESMSLQIKFGMVFERERCIHCRKCCNNRIPSVRWSSWTHFKWFSIDACFHWIRHNWFVHVASRHFRIQAGSPLLLHDAAEMLTQCICYWFY